MSTSCSGELKTEMLYKVHIREWTTTIIPLLTTIKLLNSVTLILALVRAQYPLPKMIDIQWNLDSSNTDGSFTMANSNSFLNPYEVLLIAQENKYLGKYFILKLYVVCTH